MPIGSGAMTSDLRRRLRATALALAAGIALAACVSDATGAIGAPTGETTTEPSPEPSTTAEPTPSETSPSDSPAPTGETGLVDAVNLCEELDLQTLSRLTELRLRPGTFDGAACAWEAKDGHGTLVMSFGEAERTSGYIDHLKSLDFGEAVTVAGADDAAGVTITAGAEGLTRVAVVAKIGRDRLSVILTSANPSLETAVQIAELVTNA